MHLPRGKKMSGGGFGDAARPARFSDNYRLWE
jgi:hypothetical protein